MYKTVIKSHDKKWAWPHFVKIVVVFVMYVVTARIGLALDAVGGFATLVWPPTGISLAALVIFGRQLWPGIVMGAFLANSLNGASVFVACGIAVGNTLEAIVGAYLLEKRDFQPALSRLKDVFTLVIYAALLSTLISATLGVSSLWLGNTILSFASIRSTWMAWWVGDALGNLIVAPLIFVWHASRIRNRAYLKKHLLEVCAFVGAPLLMSAIVFDLVHVSFLKTDPLPYLVFPIIFWAALRFGTRAAATTTFFISTLAIVATAHGLGPFVRASLVDGLIYLQFFSGAISVTSMILAAANSEVQKREIELRRAKEAADAASAAKSTFLANMSHEIRSPLAAVLGFSELIANQNLPLQERQHYLLAIKRNGQLLSTIVNDILDLSKVEAGMLKIEKLRVELSEVVSDVTTLLSLQATEKGIDLNVVWHEDVPHFIETDPNRLKQILINIVGNAIKFTNRGRVELHIHYSPANVPQAKLTFLVSDTGPGLLPEQASKLFEPFSQAADAAQPKQSGTGLGLVVAKGLARLLGGDVSLKHSIPGQGSTFAVTIVPGTVEGERIEHEEQALQLLATNHLEGVQVLVVDDAPDNRLLVSQMLQLAGALVDTAANGMEAIQKVHRQTYDVLLMDLQMPVMDGYEAVSTLRKEGYQKPVIALTAHALKDELQRCLDSGFNDHMSKPIFRHTLLERIAKNMAT